MRVFISLHTTVAWIENRFTDELGFISEKDPAWLCKWAREAKSWGCIACSFWGWYGCVVAAHARQTVWWSTHCLPAMFLVLVVASSSTAWNTASSNTDVQRRPGRECTRPEARWFTLTKRECEGVWRCGENGHGVLSRNISWEEKAVLWEKKQRLDCGAMEKTDFFRRDPFWSTKIQIIFRSALSEERSGHIQKAPKHTPKVMFWGCFTDFGQETLHQLKEWWIARSTSKYLGLDWF